MFSRPKKKSREADDKKKRFNDPKGDHLTLMNVFDAWTASGFSEDWARANFLHQKELEKAYDIRNQLAVLMHTHGVPIVKANGRYVRTIIIRFHCCF